MILLIEIWHISSLHEQICLTRWKICHFSEVDIMDCHTIFLGQNLMGNSKKESKIQNYVQVRRYKGSFAAWYMSREARNQKMHFFISWYHVCVYVCVCVCVKVCVWLLWYEKVKIVDPYTLFYKKHSRPSFRTFVSYKKACSGTKDPSWRRLMSLTS